MDPRVTLTTDRETTDQEKIVQKERDALREHFIDLEEKNAKATNDRDKLLKEINFGKEKDLKKVLDDQLALLTYWQPIVQDGVDRETPLDPHFVAESGGSLANWKKLKSNTVYDVKNIELPWGGSKEKAYLKMWVDPNDVIRPMVTAKNNHQRLFLTKQTIRGYKLGMGIDRLVTDFPGAEPIKIDLRLTKQILEVALKEGVAMRLGDNILARLHMGAINPDLDERARHFGSIYRVSKKTQEKLIAEIFALERQVNQQHRNNVRRNEAEQKGTFNYHKDALAEKIKALKAAEVQLKKATLSPEEKAAAKAHLKEALEAAKHALDHADFTMSKDKLPDDLVKEYKTIFDEANKTLQTVDLPNQTLLNVGFTPDEARAISTASQALNKLAEEAVKNADFKLEPLANLQELDKNMDQLDKALGEFTRLAAGNVSGGSNLIQIQTSIDRLNELADDIELSFATQHNPLSPDEMEAYRGKVDELQNRLATEINGRFNINDPAIRAKVHSTEHASMIDAHMEAQNLAQRYQDVQNKINEVIAVSNRPRSKL